MEPGNEVVRKQLTQAINRRNAVHARLERQLIQAQKDVEAQAAHLRAVGGEIAALKAHLASLGGPVEKPKKEAKK